MVAVVVLEELGERFRDAGWGSKCFINVIAQTIWCKGDLYPFNVQILFHNDEGSIL